ncbi:MAG: dinitrogenase iron-molybdenum cofactor biosynthesis protein [Provencibacterium sp.]|jgi:predicted Fe-Mo cluster-binding NifX family protein|nr:dinitrogenase iron-molybdenum cofactor biosynthesis protein [Provencibacterium sp.]
MRIAVTYENGLVFQHFGHTSQFKLYDVENGQILTEQIAGTAGSGHGALAGLLSGLKVDALICGGIGGGAKDALAQAGIRLYGGVTGRADDAVKALLAGTLEYNPDVQCNRHEHEHHGPHGHCGENMHGCAGGKCGE